MAARKTTTKATEAEDQTEDKATDQTADKAEEQTNEPADGATAKTAATESNDEGVGGTAQDQAASAGAGDAGEADRGDVPRHVVTVVDDVATVEVVDLADTPVVARRLLDACDDPLQVTTVTSPKGWKVPADVARKAGLA